MDFKTSMHEPALRHFPQQMMGRYEDRAMKVTPICCSPYMGQPVSQLILGCA